MDLLQRGAQLFDKINGVIDEFRGEKAAREAQVAEAIKKLGIHGRGVMSKKIQILQGSISTIGAVAGFGDFANMTRDDGANSEAYLHLDTGIKPEKYQMVMYHITGMDFYGLLNHDARCWGYIGYGGIHSQAANADPLQPHFYLGSNGNGFLRLKLKKQYYNHIAIDGSITFSGSAADLKFISGRITALTTETI